MTASYHPAKEGKIRAIKKQRVIERTTSFSSFFMRKGKNIGPAATTSSNGYAQLIHLLPKEKV
jgi:hypothetical protein